MSEQGSWLEGDDDNTTNATTVARPYPSGLQVVVMWVIPSLMVAFNTVVFIFAPRMKSTRPCIAKMSYGMISLATTDFTLGVLLLIKITYMSHIDFTLDESNPMCTIIGYGKTVVSVVSILTLTFLSVDRLLILAVPLHYSRYLTRRRVKLIHAAIWLFVTAALVGTIAAGAGRIRYYQNSFGCIPDWSESLVISILTLVLIHVLPALVILTCFVGVFHIARRRGAGRFRSGGSSVHRGKTDDTRRHRQRDLRIFRSLAIMTFGYYITWTPYFALVAIPTMVTGNPMYPAAEFITPWVSGCNSFWNPIIYILTMRPFYNAMVGVFGGVCATPARRSQLDTASDSQNSHVKSKPNLTTTV